MFHLYNDNIQKETVLQSLMSNETITGNLVTSFSLNINFTYNHFVSLLYYLGLITIEKRLDNGKYRFKTPNQVIRDIYFDYYYSYLSDNTAITDIVVADALADLEENANIIT